MTLHTRGFTLVELSIVLVILGLLVGGVLTGQSLIRAAEIRSVATEASRYSTAIHTFRDKYFSLPGDMVNATAYWGTAADCPGDSTHVGNGTQTCNGNGDGVIAASTSSYEFYRAWQQLANAGLIEGNYTGTCGLASCPTAPPQTGWSTKIGVTSPQSKLSNAGWSFFGIGQRALSDYDWFDGDYGNTLFVGAVGSPSLTWAPIFKPEEAYNVDMKLDDGKPAAGRIRTLENQGGGVCSDLPSSTTVTMAASVYMLANNAKVCTLTYTGGF